MLHWVTGQMQPRGSPSLLSHSGCVWEGAGCALGGLRGKISAHGVKESCFNWERKGRERNVKTTQTFLSLQGCRSPACSSGGKTAPWERDLSS